MTERLTTQQVAAALGLTEPQLQQVKRRSGANPPKASGVCLWRPEDVAIAERYLERRRGRGAPPLKAVAIDSKDSAALRAALGARAQQARQRLGLTRPQLAARMGRSKEWVRGVEKGAQFPPPYLLLFLADATGLSLDWFYGRADG